MRTFQRSGPVAATTREKRNVCIEIYRGNEFGTGVFLGVSTRVGQFGNKAIASL